MSRSVVKVRKSSAADARLLLANMRAADYAELEASHGKYADFEAVIVKGMEMSRPMSWTMFVDGELWLVGGVVKGGSLLGGEVGIPWLLGTNAIRGGVLTRTAMKYRDKVRKAYPELANLVDARNTKAIAWLKRLGFEIENDPVLAGPDRMKFYRFRMR